MKLRDLFKLTQTHDRKQSESLIREALKHITASPIGRELSRRASKEGKSLESLVQTILPTAVLSPNSLLATIVIDPSVTGFAAILDGKIRFAWLYLFAQQGRISAELDLPVVELSCSTDTTPPAGVETGFIQPAAIRHYLKENWQQIDNSKGIVPREEIISHFTRRLVRHLASQSGNSRHAVESALLALELSRYLPQVKVAEVMWRSEAWVSSILRLKNIEEQYLEALQAGDLSLSNALIIAESSDSQERALLFELSSVQKLSSRSLRVALQFLRHNEGFARHRDAIFRLMKLLEERLISIREQTFARLKLMFRNRQPLWQVRFFHRKDRKKKGETLQTVTQVSYRALLAKLRSVEEALSTFPV